jgi:hypothetical protein
MEDEAQNRLVELVCAKCGKLADSSHMFCDNCGATLRPPIPLGPSPPAVNPAPMPKRILRGGVKAIAGAAALVFFFDNRSSGMAGIALVASVAVLFLCWFVWLIFDLGDDHGFWPRKSDL